MRRVIITGATGAIGTALIRECIDNGIETLVLCREGSPRNKNIPCHSLVAKRFCSLNGLRNVQNDTGKKYDVFYHLAWDGTFGAARNDIRLQSKNIEYALDAVDAAQRFGCHTFVGAGSQAEYGRVEGVLKPDTPAFPENGYGIGKLSAGQLTRAYAQKLGMRHIWVRVLSVYGPHDGDGTMIMSAIRKLQAGETPQFTKGEQMWDYLYSGDAADAFRLLGEKGIDGKIYVLGSGQTRPLAEYIRELRDIVAPDGTIELGAIPYGENQVMHLCADISELERDLGWRPVVSYAEGIRRICGSWKPDG